MPKILGISALYHDSAAALLIDGEVAAAAQEERFTRIKHDERFPMNSIRFCLEKAKIAPRELDHVVFYEKPLIKFERLLETYLRFAPRGFDSFRKAMPVWLAKKIFQKSEMIEKFRELDPDIDWSKKILFSEHHLSHAASAFFPSPFEEALVLTMDGVGEHATTSVAIGKGNELKIVKEIHFPHSIGLLYSAFTYFLGFKVNSGEYKVMGLAPYGRPIYVDKIFKHLVDLKEDGSFRLNMKYFEYCTGSTMTNQHFADLFEMPKRTPEQQLKQEHMDMAASIQAATEEMVFRLAESLRKEFGQKNLCLAGGVALNCVANGKLLQKKTFDGIWIQPAAGDAGGSLGAAYVAHHLFLAQPRTVTAKDKMRGSYLGPSFSASEVETRLRKVGAVFHTKSEEEILDLCVNALAAEQAVGWHQGPMEFGPRALGGRSILGDARSPAMQTVLNLKVKYRESFRPFAPVVLRENVSDWFDLNEDSPYMLLVANVKEQHRKKLTSQEEALFGIEKLKIPRSSIPAVTHVDYSARIQTVHEETNPKFHALLKKFRKATGTPVLVNTSFNVRGEPIVCSPEDSYRCFMGTDIEVLVVENCILYKHEQPAHMKQDYKDRFELD
jgi:carbamoyltransferase